MLFLTLILTLTLSIRSLSSFLLSAPWSYLILTLNSNSSRNPNPILDRPEQVQEGVRYTIARSPDNAQA